MMLWDDSQENDLALNVDHIFEADECDAFDSDVDEGPTSQTMFMANLTSEDPIYDEAGPSYETRISILEMQNDVQHNYVVDSDADYTSDSNIIPYDQYVEDNEEHVVQCNASSVRNDALMSILDEMHEQGVQKCVIGTCPKSFNERDNKAPSTPVTRKKQVTFSDKPGTSSSNTQKHKVHQRVQQTNIPVLPSTGVNDSTEASGSKPRSNTKKNRILPAKKEVEVRLRTNKSVWTKVNPVDSSTSSKRVIWKPKGKLSDNSLNKTKQIWKPKDKLSDNSLYKTQRVWKATGKLFADIGYQWRPTGKKLTLGKLDCGSQWRPTGKKFALGEICQLTKLSVKCLLYMLTKGPQHKIGETESEISKLDCFQMQVVQIGNDNLEQSWVMGLVMGGQCDLNGLLRQSWPHLYTISIDDMMKSSPDLLLSNASKPKSWENFSQSLTLGFSLGMLLAGRAIDIYNKRTHRLMETIHVTFDEMHQSMAPVHMSSGPAPFIMTPGQLKSGLAPTDKELEMLFQPMFDEHLEPISSNEPVPFVLNLMSVVPPGTSLSTTIAQDAPSTSASSSTSDIHLPVQHQEITEEPIQEDTPIIHDVLPPSHNLVTGDPEDGPKHLLWITLVEPKNFKMAVIEDCWFQAMQDEIHEFDRLEVWELVPRPIYVMVIALKWIYKVKLDEYGDVLKNKARLVAQGISSGGKKIGCQICFSEWGDLQEEVFCQLTGWIEDRIFLSHISPEEGSLWA
ncbi:retrovirus-related pol polyprotein from transposon TNT 1-94 [Tanacetum coccineum]